MNKISDLISMPVISMYEGNYVGIIYNIHFDCKQKKCKYITILNEVENISKCIKINDIYKIGKECIFIKNEECLELQSNNDNELIDYINPINMKVYSLNGELIGNSIDVTLNKYYQIDELQLNNGKTIKSSEIFNIGKNIILTQNNHTNISKFKPKTKIKTSHCKKDDKVVILNTPQETSLQQEIQNNKIITDFRFLIGREIIKDIIALNGEIIAKTGNIVSKDIVNKASSYGKLIDISRNSIKKRQ